MKQQIDQYGEWVQSFSSSPEKMKW